MKGRNKRQMNRQKYLYQSIKLAILPMIANCTTTAMGYCCRLYKSSQGRTDLIFNRKIKEKIMKNDAENQKKYPQNFFKRHSEHNPGNYITISKEINFLQDLIVFYAILMTWVKMFSELIEEKMPKRYWIEFPKSIKQKHLGQ